MAVGAISVAWGLLDVRRRWAELPLWVDAAFFVAFVSATVGTFAVSEALRRALRVLARTWNEPLLVGLETLALFEVGFAWDSMASVSGPRAHALAAACAALVASHAALRPRWPRLCALLASVGFGALVVLDGTLNPRLYGTIHMACFVGALNIVAHLAEYVRPSRSWSAPRLTAVAAVALGLSHAALHDPRVRHRFRGQSVHAAAIAKPLALLTDLDRDGGSVVFGGTDCAPFDGSRGPFAVEIAGDGVDQDCDGRDAPTSSAPRTEAGPSGARPDIVVVSLDAVRQDAAFSLTRLRAVLPQAFVFTRAVSTSPRTRTSFGAMMRGRTMDEIPFDRGEVRFALADADLPTVGDLFRAAGYRAGFVATCANLSPRVQIVGGFEEWREAQMPYDDPDVRGTASMLDADVALARLFGEMVATEGAAFGWTHLLETHEPYRRSLQERFANDFEGYLAAIRVQDARVADALVDFSRRRGREPVVVVVGDHGEAFGEHGVRSHASDVHAEQVRVPLLISVPGLRGRRIDAPVSTAALASTLAELAGLRPSPSFHMRSLVPCMRDEDACPEVAISEHFPAGHAGDVAVRAFTTRTNRILVDRSHDFALVYDAMRDPGERHPYVITAARAMRLVDSLDAGRW